MVDIEEEDEGDEEKKEKEAEEEDWTQSGVQVSERRRWRRGKVRTGQPAREVSARVQTPSSCRGEELCARDLHMG